MCAPDGGVGGLLLGTRRSRARTRRLGEIAAARTFLTSLPAGIAILTIARATSSSTGSMLAASCAAAVARPVLRASRAQKRAGARVSASGNAAGNAFWDRMVAKATGKDAVTTETALFALG